ncbi:hypothetical protein F511_13752 [Dorcoceras hygrometricum]|uniref:Uncharacterized protein n=1 Tax=Dorcoceras hygrometricum TaxID=472368 RepID=A0A2Z7BR34_9LAMI|nr:hypothetical protein F511_13752 [Dorcoceras hygrometricum]
MAAAAANKSRAAMTCAAQPRNAMRDKRIFARHRSDHRATSAHDQRATAGHHWRNNLRIAAAIGRATCAAIAPTCAQAAVDRQSGPRPDSIFLQSACTRKLMDLPRTESPRRGDRNKSDHEAGDGTRRREALEEGAEAN